MVKTLLYGLMISIVLNFLFSSTYLLLDKSKNKKSIYVRPFTKNRNIFSPLGHNKAQITFWRMALISKWFIVAFGTLLIIHELLPLLAWR